MSLKIGGVVSVIDSQQARAGWVLAGIEKPAAIVGIQTTIHISSSVYDLCFICGWFFHADEYSRDVVFKRSFWRLATD